MCARLNVQRESQINQTTFSRWLFQVIAKPGVRLKIRLLGNNLHILYQSNLNPSASSVVEPLVKALKSQENLLQGLTTTKEHPIYKIILYGSTVGKKQPTWVESIVLNQLIPEPTPKQGVTRREIQKNAPEEAKISLQELAQQGKLDAVARYLSNSFSYLGLRVKVFRQKLATTANTPLKQRLFVFCYCNYPPELGLLAEPIAKQLRELQLDYDSALVCAQVTGEAEPEWVLKVNLTPDREILESWGRWGDISAIARLLNQSLAKLDISVRVVHKEANLHLFCSQSAETIPPQANTVAILTEQLQALTPQGISTATIYGVEVQDSEKVTWLEHITLSLDRDANLLLTPLSLAKKGNIAALTFLFQRLVNPDLGEYLATGGIEIQLHQKQDLLYIITEGFVCPAQAQIVQPIEALLRELLIGGIAGVRLYGRRAGQGSPQWSYGVDFVSRKSKVQPTPEFVSGKDLFALVHVPKEEGDTEDTWGTKVEEENQSLKKAVDAVTTFFCRTRLFIRPNQTQTFSHHSKTEEYSAYEGVKIALVWSVLGLLLTVQADWLVGRLLLLQPTTRTNHNFFISPSSASSEAEVGLPEISLQQSEDLEEGFNGSGFTSDLRNATTTAILAAARSQYPTFNNTTLDEKLALYEQRVITQGVPDILIVGSSRAMRGIEPRVLQQALGEKGYDDLDIYNFGINGATAQVVELIVKKLISPQQLPKLIIWADGARAFNSGRRDLTFDAIAFSPGYEKIQAGKFKQDSQEASPSTPQFNLKPDKIDDWLNQQLAQRSSTYPQRSQLKSILQEQLKSTFPVASPPDADPEMETEMPLEMQVNLNGFLSISRRFDPESYYESHAKVAGAYDSDYTNFALDGLQQQALDNIITYLDQHQVPLVFINTPLTDEYLDPVRQEHEQEFQAYMRNIAIAQNFIFRDLSSLWSDEYDYFSDPSHLNRYGADQVSRHLAQDAVIPWVKAQEQ